MTAAPAMLGAYLPGDSTVELRELTVPEPGPRQALVRMRASGICGSDVRAIYREHLGKGPEAYRDVVAGHEPAGEIVALGPGARRFKLGDRVAVYHIAGCGLCEDCRHGYMISCRSPLRAAYGWQRDGGHAPFLLAEEDTLVRLPDSLSFEDGALVACGFGTAYEALTRMRASGADRLCVTGLGPVGLAAAMLGRALGAREVFGVDAAPDRLALALDLGLVDHAFAAGDRPLERLRAATGDRGCELCLDASGAPAGRRLALQATRQWGRCAFVGEGGSVEFDVSKDLIHNQVTLFGSWVTSLKHMEDLVERLDRWRLRPDRIVTHRFPLDDAGMAYETAAAARCGKVCVVFD